MNPFKIGDIVIYKHYKDEYELVLNVEDNDRWILTTNGWTTEFYNKKTINSPYQSFKLITSSMREEE